MKKTVGLTLSVCSVVLLTAASDYSPAKLGATLELSPTPTESNTCGEAPASLAGPIPLVSGGGWVTVFWSTPGQPVPADDGPFTFTVAPVGARACVTVVDCCLKGDRFELSDNGNYLGRTSLVGLGSFTAGGPDAALADPSYSSGVFAVDGGLHSIDVQVINNPYYIGVFHIRLDPQGSSYCPDPNPIDAIEAKLDALDATGVQADLTGLTADVAALETKLDALDPEVDALEAKLDAVEVKLDALAGQSAALETKLDALEAKADALETKLDALAAQVTDLKAEVVALAAAVEQALLDRIAKACMDKRYIAAFYLPEANGGLQQTVRQLVIDTIANVTASGESTNSAATYKSQGDASIGFGFHKRAYREYCIAYCRAVSETTSNCSATW